MFYSDVIMSYACVSLQHKNLCHENANYYSDQSPINSPVNYNQE
jgi:hypothetical protein